MARLCVAWIYDFRFVERFIALDVLWNSAESEVSSHVYTITLPLHGLCLLFEARCCPISYLLLQEECCIGNSRLCICNTSPLELQQYLTAVRDRNLDHLNKLLRALPTCTPDWLSHEEGAATLQEVIPESLSSPDDNSPMLSPSASPIRAYCDQPQNFVLTVHGKPAAVYHRFDCFAIRKSTVSPVLLTDVQHLRPCKLCLKPPGI